MILFINKRGESISFNQNDIEVARENHQSDSLFASGIASINFEFVVERWETTNNGFIESNKSCETFSERRD